MSIWLIALIFGIALGLLVAILQFYRVSMYKNPLVIRYPDGSVYGGLFKVVFGVFLLWTIIGFVGTLPFIALVLWIT